MGQHNLFVANWKMYFSYQQAQLWIQKNQVSLRKMTDNSHKTIILCPSFETIATAQSLLNHDGIRIGAQDCSAFLPGAYTGQVSAQSLAEIGCSYCIIGHSERLQYGAETASDTRSKLERLIEVSIIPILCIGETKEEYQKGYSLSSLEQQTTALLKDLKKQPAKLIIAYEPRWAIGSNTIPKEDELIAAQDILLSLSKKLLPEASISLIYGGSVDVNTTQTIKKMNLFNGFLIGRASLDFQSLQNIVL